MRGSVRCIAELPYKHMFDSRNLVSIRETAAVLALMARRDPTLPWNRLAGAIEEEGSALALLGRLAAGRRSAALHGR